MLLKPQSWLEIVMEGFGVELGVGTCWTALQHRTVFVFLECLGLPIVFVLGGGVFVLSYDFIGLPWTTFSVMLALA